MRNEIVKIADSLHPKKAIEITNYIKKESYLELSRGKKIYDLMQNDAEDGIIDALAYAQNTIGSKGDDIDFEFCASEIRLTVLEFYPYMTIEEIQEAIKRGAKGEYGEFFGINLKSCIHFIKCFLRNEERLAAIQKQDIKPQSEQKVMKVSEWKALILNDFRLMKEGNQGVIVFMPKKYQLLESLGHISLTDDQCKEWMRRSKIELENRKTLKAKMKKDKSLLGEIKQIAEEFESGEMSNKTESVITSNAQKMIYFEFLRQMAARGIEDFFTQKNTYTFE